MHNETTYQRFHSAITADPSVGAPDGEIVKFQSITLRIPDDAQRYAPVSDPTASRGIVLAVIFIDDDGAHIRGSSVVVSAGVSLAATHVVDDFIPSLMAGSSVGYCIGWGSEGTLIWRISHITAVPGTDISILGLRLASDMPSDRNFFYAAISMRPPRQGEAFSGFGYSAKFGDFPDGFSAALPDSGIIVSGALISARGIAQQIHIPMRDKLLVPFPAVEVDFPAWGGMSGGPVFDMNGRLVGIVSRSLEHEDGDPSPTTVSLLWPALCMPFKGGWPMVAPPSETQTLLSIGEGMSDIDGREFVKFESIPDGESIGIRFSQSGEV